MNPGQEQPVPPSGEEPAAGERPGIFGSETEYAVLYFPDDPADASKPPFSTIEEILFDSLLEGRKAAVSSGLKGGYFLQNGGLVHLEIFLRTQADTPILEASTPECRSPRDLLAYQRAFDGILTETAERSREALAKRGFAGRIAFGKNNRDVHGIGYGCHENYLVHQKTGLLDRLLIFLGSPLVVLFLAPSIVLILLVLILVILGNVFTLAFPRFARALATRCARTFPHAKEWTRAVYFVVMNVLLFVPIFLYSLILRFTALRPFQRDLTSFLATRQIITGAGGLDEVSGSFEIAQRPRLTRSLGKIVIFGRHKTIFDLKGFLYNPLTILRARRKLTITVGDSNLSDVPLLLSTGTTALVIEMIEAGVRFDDLRLRRPLRALRQVSRGGPWKEVRVRGAGDPGTPGRRTAIGIQREFLRRAKEHFAGRPEGLLRRREILTLWEETLTTLAEAPGKLSDRLDWAAKKSLLDAAVLSGGTWRDFAGWWRILSLAPGVLLSSCRSLEDLLERSALPRRLRLARRVRRAVRRGEIDPARFESARDLFFLARKIDLRYHEIGGDPGYQRQLEAEGLLRRLASDDEIARAAREPPPDTRARIRGYYIGLAEFPRSVRASWNSIELPGASRTIPLPDPFEFRIPSDS